MNTVLCDQFCVSCYKQLEMVNIPEVIQRINILKIKYNCVFCKSVYSVTWNYHTNFCTKFKEKN